MSNGGNGAAERLDRFMGRANAAYYAGRDPFADFATAPEIAQVFGELLGAWAAVSWTAMGSPDPVRLCEVGPGRGTLMADALRLVRRVAPEFHAALDLHLVETSPRLRAIQQAALPGEEPRWHDAIDTLPAGPLILLGNEFLDALPIRQFVRANGAWLERHVTAEGFVLLPADAPPEGPADAPEGAVLEVNQGAERVVAALAARLRAGGGMALFLDYGPARFGYGDTLQALRDGRPTDPLAAPGEADLTAHVPFPRLRAVAEANGARVHGPVPQGAFLSALGLFPRTERLMRGQTAERARALLDAAHRLAAPERMGRLFKAMVLCHPGLPVPAGFEEGTGE